ncbi:hypothetical protein A2380_01990 [candidate division WWE3 bacterium RIFOXYB1_FULL_43_24]|uniref:Zn-dependent hydrolase of the beta-lactamase fold-like protein n=2 Tax=Katanobacteria TaxID=422282 RepID=A0A0G1AX07_UNCKA|nr:MAG: Zn-dependent hydrolase of the beta-lactamase fold-like protein [candidate division WWE3 bacterium GW2011_GWA1_42_12]KKS34309.1 MAG: Zn-dependent hydrolase of the beta-lactamase fold-like protein [candidate division WWE3 bacterium GW2011_GWD1_42_14]KKS38611.1 MAG: Zn-dependent hydrolase of the beta-lactamase fold-like protein [candidate division WWE3 bacterium GW2011_GWF1_42_14]KKS40436.1 MAG: Zn-dependent hydrolase of the beta-lactamase fold-like protein [candidate division WWE3 bacteriu
MEITYIGHSCFKIKGKKDLTIVIDPYDPKIGYKLPKMDADILLTTHNHFDHYNISGVSGYKLLIDGPGEYEVNGAFIYGIPTFHDDKKGDERGTQTMYVIDIDGFTLMHLGDLGHELNTELLEKISKVDVLMIPIGGVYTINAEKAAQVISSLEPGIVLPMHYKTDDLVGFDDLQGLDKFMDEMGIENNVKREEKLKISSGSDIPEDTEVIILKPAH